MPSACIGVGVPGSTRNASLGRTRTWVGSSLPTLEHATTLLGEVKSHPFILHTYNYQRFHSFQVLRMK